MKIPFEFEILDENDRGGILRFKVIGGWIVTCQHSLMPAMTSTFVPDPNYEWEV